jgi:CheY-like chemotaxis protein
LLTILVVDDDARQRELLARMLRVRGYAVVEAADGRDGLDQYYRLQPALVICDILMPEMDGLEMIGALRGAHVRAPIIAMLEIDDFQAALLLEIAMKMGADDTLLKPLETERLLRAVGSLLAPQPH